MSSKVYVLCRRDLSPQQRTVQITHAVVELVWKQADDE